MSDRINETDIRARLERFYSGESDNAEVRRLAEALEELQPLPPDLRMELDLLTLMLRGAELEDDAVEVPVALEDRLRADIHRYAVAGRRRLLRRSIAGWSVAASVALLAAVSVRYMGEVPVNLSDNGGVASVGSDSAQLAHINTDSAIVNIAAVDTAVSAALAFKNPAPAEQARPAKTAMAASSKKTVTASEYSKQADTQSDVELIGLVMEQIRDDAKDVGSTIAEEFRNSMQESRLSLASTINESRTADVGLAGGGYYDSNEEIPIP